jgi:protein-tyrosine phosphatase
MAESLELCQIAVASGTTHAICTPHIHPGRWENTRQSIQQGFENLKFELSKNNIPLNLGFAGEVRLTDQLMHQVTQEHIPYYGEVDGFQIMLLEFPHAHIIPGSEKLVQWLLKRNIRPLIAHPERNKQIMKDPALLQPFLAAGCWLQLTAGSVTGSFGEQAQLVASQLLEDDSVAVIASDGHNTKARQPKLKQAYTHISEHYGEARAKELTFHTPERIAGSQFKPLAGTAT